MTEKEKMLAGEMYDGSEKTLCKERTRAKTLCEELNRTPVAAGNPARVIRKINKE